MIREVELDIDLHDVWEDYDGTDIDFMLDAYRECSPDIGELLDEACSGVTKEVLDWAKDKLDVSLQTKIYGEGSITMTEKLFLVLIERLIYNKNNFQIPVIDEITRYLNDKNLI